MPLSSSLYDLFQSVECLHETRDTRPGISTGFLDLDHLLRGFHGGDLLVLASRPGMGRSALATCLAANVAIEGAQPVLFVSAAESRHQVTSRIVASRSGIDLHRLGTGLLDPPQWAVLSATIGAMAEVPFYIEDAPEVTPGDIWQAALRVKTRHGTLGLVVLDLFHDDAWQPRNLKVMARELNVPILWLAPVLERVDDRDDPTPRLADLASLPRLAEYADVVMFLYREAYYHPETDCRKLARIHVAKQRRGVTGLLELVFDAATTAFWTPTLTDYAG